MRHVKIATVHVCLRACMYIFHLCVKYLNACTLIVLKCLHVYCLFGVYMCSWVCMCRLLWVYPVPTSLAWESEQTVWVFISAGQWLKVRPERTCWVDRLSATSSGQMGPGGNQQGQGSLPSQRCTWQYSVALTQWQPLSICFNFFA